MVFFFFFFVKPFEKQWSHPCRTWCISQLNYLHHLTFFFFPSHFILVDSIPSYSSSCPKSLCVGQNPMWWAFWFPCMISVKKPQKLKRRCDKNFLNTMISSWFDALQTWHIYWRCWKPSFQHLLFLVLSNCGGFKKHKKFNTHLLSIVEPFFFLFGILQLWTDRKSSKVGVM